MKTLALTMIVKNEAHNLPRLFKSCYGLFDHAYITDTGSTDSTIEYLKSIEARLTLGCEITVLNFEWCDDFSKARNFALDVIKEDYWMWMDGDDSMSNKETFFAWKRSSMGLSDVWFSPYIYSMDENRKPLVKFVRERAFKTSLDLRFRDFIHEGVNAQGLQCSAVDSWCVLHERTKEEAQGDQGRNLRLLEARSDLSTRMQFYLGKEYFDANMHEKCAGALREVLKKQDMQQGDRILALQYLIHSLIILKQYPEAISYGHIGINLDPIRAEYYCFVGDCYTALNKLIEAIPYYKAATGCHNKGSGLTHEFTFETCYFEYPQTQLAKIYYHMGDFRKALEECRDLRSEEAMSLRMTCEKNIVDMDFSQAHECEDIVITCPMQAAYPWDEEIYKTKGLGGSETAAIEMSKHLKFQTKRSVKIFQERESTFVAPSGVEYIPLKYIHNYFKKWKPKLHIAWRHNIKFTNAYTAVWCHDLMFEALRNHENYNMLLALSPFHKEFLISSTGVPKEKIHITRNGIEPERFLFLDKAKQYGKVIWPNSPDRGLEYAINVMDLVREKIPGAELHCFYGMENLYKYGQKEKADMLKMMIKERPWVKYHGNVDQQKLAIEFASSEVWLYPASFIETFNITALEALLSHCWPVVRAVGALRDTLKIASDRGMADLVDIEPIEYEKYAELVVKAIELKKYQDIKFTPEDFSWHNVSLEWVKLFSL